MIAKPGKTPACPKCGELPQLSILKPEEHAARTWFLCSLCRHEWEYQLLLCPKCGQTDFDLLPVYRAKEFPHIRVDACDSCKTYLLSIDPSVDPQAVPLVDELAAISLNLWAQEQGYTKLQLNLFGL